MLKRHVNSTGMADLRKSPIKPPAFTLPHFNLGRELFAAHLARGVAPEPLAGINPNDPVETVAERLSGWDDDTLVAGHQPFMGKLVALLIAGRAEPPVVDYRQGAVACLERDAGNRWVLAWMVRPELLADGSPR